MSKTSLDFYRRDQDLKVMKTERPKDIATFREAVRQSLAQILLTLKDLETEFYECESSDQFIRRIVKPLRHVMKFMEVTYIHASYQFDDMNRRMNDPTDDDKKPEVVAFNEVMRVEKRIQKYVPAAFGTILDELREVLRFMEKYCLTMCKGKYNPAMETVQHYELKKKDIVATINTHIDNILIMGRKYKHVSGLNVKMFGLQTNELARRCDVGDLPFLLIFPESCCAVRNAVQGVELWLLADEEFVDFIKQDVTSLNSKITAQQKLVQEHYLHKTRCDHKLRNLRKEMQILKKELSNSRDSEIKLLADIKQRKDQVQKLTWSMEYKNVELDRLKSLNCAEDIELKAAEISDIRYEIPALNREIDHIIAKMKPITSRQHRMSKLEKERKRTESDVTRCELDLRQSTKTLTEMESAHKTMKEIKSKKTSPDYTKKIFFELPITLSRAKSTKLPPIQEQKTKQPTEKLTVAIKLASRRIGTDWQKLYNALPFYPARGNGIIDHDLAQILTDTYKQTAGQRAEACLEKWRRQHSRPNVTQLLDALRQIRRHDVVEEIEKKQTAGKSLTRRSNQRARKNWRKYKVMFRVMQLRPGGFLKQPLKMYDVEKQQELSEPKKALLARLTSVTS